MSDSLSPQSPDPDEPDFQQMLSNLLGGAADNPQLAEALKAMGVDRLDPAAMGMISAQLKAMLSASPDEPFNAELATDVARKTVSAAGDASVGDAARREVEEAAHVAGLWLDDVTQFTAPGVAARAWSRAEWVDQTMPVWRTLVEPVASGVSAAIVAAMRGQMGNLDPSQLPPGVPAGMDLGAMMGQMEPMLARMSASMFGAQVGQAVGALGGDTLSGTEVGLPLVQGNAVALVPANIAAFAEGLEVDLAEVRLYLAVREAARVRLFADVPWLGPQLVAAVQAYARDISIDTDRIESALQSVDPTDPAAMQSALSDSLFTPEPSAAQQAALSRLETYLALVEGWVDVVADRATAPHLPHGAALGEAVRRRRASGGPAERIVQPAGRARAAPTPPARRREPLGGPGVQRRRRRPRRRLGAPRRGTDRGGPRRPAGLRRAGPRRGQRGRRRHGRRARCDPARGRVRRRTRVSGPTAASASAAPATSSPLDRPGTPASRCRRRTSGCASGPRHS